MMVHFLRRLFGLEPRLVFVMRERSAEAARVKARTTSELRRIVAAQRNAAIQREGVRGR